MSPLDAAFLDAEDEDRHASLAIASIAVLEGPAPTQAEFAERIAGKLPLLPRFRQKVRQVPLDLAPPVWVDDPHFDLRYHLGRTALPAPGGDAQLCRLMGRVMSQRLDRDRPLWEYWVVEALADDRWALLLKVHHCMVDGVSGTNLYRVIFDSSPEQSAAVPDLWQPAPEPSTLRLTTQAVRELALNPVQQIRALSGALRHPTALARRSSDTARGMATLAGALVPAGPSSLSGRIGQQRRYGLARGSLADLAIVRGQFGGTLNDVVLALISGAFRTLLIARGERPAPHVVRSLVPVSVRAPGQVGSYENRVSLLLPFLPVDVADPVARIAAVRAQLAEHKASHEAKAGELMTSLAKYEPFPPIALGIRLASRLPHRNIVTVTTNVPGPRQPLYYLGRRVLEILPYVPIATTLRFGISIFTYGEAVTFGITGDYDNTPDIDVLARSIEDGLWELVKAAEAGAGRE